MKRKMCFLSVMILAVSVWLFQGCGKREQSRDTEVLVKVTATEDTGRAESEVVTADTGKYDYLDDGSLPASRAYVESCIDYAKEYFIPGEKGGYSYDNNLIAWDMQEDGHGIAFFTDEEGVIVGGMSTGTWANVIVLRTGDGGDTWEVNPKSCFLHMGSFQLETFGNCVIVVTYDGGREEIGGSIWTSVNYGRTIYQMPFDELYQKAVNPYAVEGVCPLWWLAGEIVGYDEQMETVDISWRKLTTKEDLYTARYQFSMMGKLVPVRVLEYSEDFILRRGIDGVIAAERAEGEQSDTFIFPQSGYNYLLEQDIQAVCDYSEAQGKDTAMILRRAINEIYARIGYDFTGTEYYEEYLSLKNWYCPIPGKTVEEEELNPFEKANIDLLVSFEKQYR